MMVKKGFPIQPIEKLHPNADPLGVFDSSNDPHHRRHRRHQDSSTRHGRSPHNTSYNKSRSIGLSGRSDIAIASQREHRRSRNKERARYRSPGNGGENSDRSKRHSTSLYYDHHYDDDDDDIAHHRHHHQHRRHHRLSRKNQPSDLSSSSTSRRSQKHMGPSHSSKPRDSGHHEPPLSRRISKAFQDEEQVSNPTLISTFSSEVEKGISIWEPQHGTRLKVPKPYRTNEEVSSATVTSSSSSENKDKDNNDSIWEPQHGSRLEVFTANVKKRRCESTCHQLLNYTLPLCALAAVILVSAVVVGLLTSKDNPKLDESTTKNQKVDDVFDGIAEIGITTDVPSRAPTRTPFPLAMAIPTPPPTTIAPTMPPTIEPTMESMTPTEEVITTYVPGKLTVKSNGLLLSEGLQSRIIAKSGKPVTLTGLSPTSTSSQNFHQKPDGAAIFPWFETGGWVYVSNSEVKDSGRGGVGAIYFDKDGNVIDYRRLLDGTTMNCGGGPTPWGTWVSCEEIDGGRAYQVDPFGIHPPEQLSILDRGFFEAFAHDARNPQKPAFYVTEDKERGPLRRLTPSNPDWEDPWKVLHGHGILEYLVLEPNAAVNNTTGSFYWTTERETAKLNSQRYYKHSEGIDVHNDQLFFVSKVQKELFILNLDSNTYEVHSTISGVFDGHPDQMKRLIHNGLLYFCEEGGRENGVHARDENGWFFTILESESLSDETTGLDFSPDGMHMYVSLQHNGLIFDVWREDGLPFHGRTLNVKYHEIQHR